MWHRCFLVRCYAAWTCRISTYGKSGELWEDEDRLRQSNIILAAGAHHTSPLQVHCQWHLDATNQQGALHLQPRSAKQPCHYHLPMFKGQATGVNDKIFGPNGMTVSTYDVLMYVDTFQWLLRFAKFINHHYLLAVFKLNGHKTSN